MYIIQRIVTACINGRCKPEIPDALLCFAKATSIRYFLQREIRGKIRACTRFNPDTVRIDVTCCLWIKQVVPFRILQECVDGYINLFTIFFTTSLGGFLSPKYFFRRNLQRFALKKCLDGQNLGGLGLKKCLDDQNPGRMTLGKPFLMKIFADSSWKSTFWIEILTECYFLIFLSF